MRVYLSFGPHELNVAAQLAHAFGGLGPQFAHIAALPLPPGDGARPMAVRIAANFLEYYRWENGDRALHFRPTNPAASAAAAITVLGGVQRDAYVVP